MEASKLKEILDQHKLWLVTNEVQGKRANLEGANLRGANVRGANLEGADLGYANLGYADLTGANLNRANLNRANLTGANLTVANLSGANLVGAILEGAILYSANLEGANLMGANLSGAYLSNANLSNAILPDISWIIPGCLVQLNHVMCEFYLEKERKREDFVQDNFGFFIQDNVEENTFDMLIEDRIIRNIPDWVKYSGLKAY